MTLSYIWKTINENVFLTMTAINRNKKKSSKLFDKKPSKSAIND
jgi:hypothetical protein